MEFIPMMYMFELYDVYDILKLLNLQKTLQQVYAFLTIAISLHIAAPEVQVLASSNMHSLP